MDDIVNGLATWPGPTTVCSAMPSASASRGQISICPLGLTSISEAGITHTADPGPTWVHREPVSRMLGGIGTRPVDQARMRSTPLSAWNQGGAILAAYRLVENSTDSHSQHDTR